MPFNAVEFRRSFDKLEPAKSNSFHVTFSGAPRVVTNQGNTPEASLLVWDSFIRNVPFRAATTDLPGRNLELYETKYAGPNINVPFSPIYQPLTIEFIEDSYLNVRAVFDRWLDFQLRGEKVGAKLGGQFDQLNSLVYYDDFIVDNIVIDVFNKKNSLISRFTFYECYPVAIAPSNVSWENNNSILRIPVEFAYRYYEIKRFYVEEQ